MIIEADNIISKINRAIVLFDEKQKKGELFDIEKTLFFSEEDSLFVQNLELLLDVDVNQLLRKNNMIIKFQGYSTSSTYIVGVSGKKYNLNLERID